MTIQKRTLSKKLKEQLNYNVPPEYITKILIKRKPLALAMGRMSKFISFIQLKTF